MKESRWMELPRIVAVGGGVLKDLPQICSRLHLEGRALIITGPHTRNVMANAIEDLLEPEGYRPDILICTASRLEAADRAEVAARES